MLSHSIGLIIKSQVHTHRPPWHTMTGPALIAPYGTHANRVLDSQRQGDGDAIEEGGIFLMMPLLTFLTQHEVVFPGSIFAFFLFFSHLPQQLPLFNNCFNSTTETHCYPFFSGWEAKICHNLADLPRWLNPIWILKKNKEDKLCYSR